jgi:Holliday junction resolvase
MTQGIPMTKADDSDRLIQEVLSELGWDDDPKKIAEHVRRLDSGLPVEDEFIAICSWLGKTSLIHKLDQHQAPAASRDLYQVPDLLVKFENIGPVLIEVKSKAKRTLPFTPRYLDRLNAYARLLNMPLLIAWKHHGIWALFEVKHLIKARTNFNITYGNAMKENLLGVLAGDVAYKIASGAGLRIRCKKEHLVSREEIDGAVAEQWHMRIDEVGFMVSGSEQVDHLDADVTTLFTTWDLSERQSHSDTHIELRFVADDDDSMMFGHMALTHLLHWSLPQGAAINWRHAIRRDTVVSNMANFRRALGRALEQKVVHLILNQQPQTWPDFLPKDAPAPYADQSSKFDRKGGGA